MVNLIRRILLIFRTPENRQDPNQDHTDRSIQLGNYDLSIEDECRQMLITLEEDGSLTSLKLVKFFGWECISYMYWYCFRGVAFHFNYQAIHHNYRHVWAFVEANVSKMEKIFPLADPILKLLPIIHPGNREKFKSSDVIKLGRALGLSGEIISNLKN